MQNNLETTLQNADTDKGYVIGTVTLPENLRARELVEQMLYPGQEVTVLSHQPERHLSRIQVGIEGTYMMGTYLTNNITVTPNYQTKVQFR